MSRSVKGLLRKYEDPSLDPNNICVTSYAWCCMSVIPVIEKRRQEEAWGLQTRQPSLARELQVQQETLCC